MLGRKIEELFLDVRVDFYVLIRHDIADYRHIYTDELMLVKGDLAEFV